jgi:hypothetical protein
MFIEFLNNYLSWDIISVPELYEQWLYVPSSIVHKVQT